MKIIKISLDHYIIVDESKQPVQGYYYDNFIKDIRDTRGAEYGEADHCWQITHSTQLDKGMDNVTFISLSEVKELIGEVDVEKKAFRHTNKLTDYLSPKEFNCMKEGYVSGYNQALGDNKDRKYTEEDMRKMFDMGEGLSSFNDSDDNKFRYALSLVQPKPQWDVEFVNGKLKLV